MGDCFVSLRSDEPESEGSVLTSTSLSQSLGLAFRQSDIPTLAIGLEFGQCPDTLLEWSVKVHPMKVVEIRLGA